MGRRKNPGPLSGGLPGLGSPCHGFSRSRGSFHFGRRAHATREMPIRNATAMASAHQIGNQRYCHAVTSARTVMSCVPVTGIWPCGSSITRVAVSGTVGNGVFSVKASDTSVSALAVSSAGAVQDGGSASFATVGLSVTGLSVTGLAVTWPGAARASARRRNWPSSGG
jgi:hypothetical protein